MDENVQEKEEGEVNPSNPDTVIPENNIPDNKSEANTAVANLDEERANIMMLQNDMASLYALLDDMYWKTFEIEEAERTANPTASVEGFTERFTEIMNSLNSRATDAGVALAETKTTLDSLQAELNTIKSELDTLKAEKAQAEIDKKISGRKSVLAELNITLENEDTILKLDDTAFDIFVSGLKQVKSSNKSVAETKIILPDPVSTDDTDTETIVESHKKLFKKGTK